MRKQREVSSRQDRLGRSESGFKPRRFHSGELICECSLVLVQLSKLAEVREVVPDCFKLISGDVAVSVCVEVLENRLWTWRLWRLVSGWILLSFPKQKMKNENLALWFRKVDFDTCLHFVANDFKNVNLYLQTYIHICIFMCYMCLYFLCLSVSTFYMHKNLYNTRKKHDRSPFSTFMRNPWAI